jgi:competence protein ComEA
VRRSAALRVWCFAAVAIWLGQSAALAGKSVDGVVNLNTAPPEVLGLIPGIGPAKAAEIVRYRSKRSFKTVDELVRIRGIGRKMVRRLRGHLAVAGPTTATAAASGQMQAAQPPPPPAPPPAIKKALAGRVAPSGVKLALRSKPRLVEPWPSHGACPRPR